VVQWFVNRNAFHIKGGRGSTCYDQTQSVTVHQTRKPRHDQGSRYDQGYCVASLQRGQRYKHDVAAKYAVSVAEAFGSHLAAITFAYEPVLPATLTGCVLPVDFVNAQRALAEEAANAAMTKF
jgi:hypothetical protein